MSTETTALRSFLFAPGNHARRVQKALSLDADAVILDLEDAVATAEKPAAREAVAAALARQRRGLLYVRVNAVDTEFCYGDLLAVVRRGLDGIILPKVESAAGLATIDWLLAQLERERGLPAGGIDLIPIIETASGLERLGAILTAGTRVRRIAFGAGDFTLDVNMVWSRGESELAPARAAIVTASRAAGIEAPLDTVWVDLTDPDGLEASARTALGLGFQGKMCIHPDQIAIVTGVFTPTDAEVAFAERVTAAFAQAEAEGSAAIQLAGKFID
ncbi:MAG TPA: CoA ester lyase, partial [Stellaceae bacterium]|nr:CoA ester lyase [Stellaceae bacterium]